jgi:hypothetical protein
MPRRAALAVLWLYRRWWTRYTPRCPRAAADGLSCSEFGRLVVAERGVRAGLVAAAERVQECGRAVVPAAPGLVGMGKDWTDPELGPCEGRGR